MTDYVDFLNIGGYDQEIQDTYAREHIAELEAAYAALTQSDIIITPDHTQIGSPEQNKIYREIGSSSYADWMWDGSAWFKMATYNNQVVSELDPNGSNIPSEKAVADYASENYALKNGYYEQLVSGHAENLIDTKGEGSEQEIMHRTSCGDVSISDDGSGVVKSFLGNSLVWNQCIVDGNFEHGLQYVINETENVTSFVNNGVLSVTTTQNTVGVYLDSENPISGHKYYCHLAYTATSIISFRLGGFYTSNLAATSDMTNVSVIGEANQVARTNIYAASLSDGQCSFQIKNVKVIDLTLMFGEGNEPSTVAEFEAMFPNAYYPYNEGTLINNSAKYIETVGFNAYNPETGKAAVLANNQYQITGTYTALSLNGNTITPDSEGLFTPTENGEQTVTGGNDTDTCVHLTWSGYRNGDYEPYWKQQTEIGLDAFQVTDGSNTITVNGLKSAGNVYDEIKDGKYIKRIGEVDLGDLTYSYTDRDGQPCFETGITGMKIGSYSSLSNLLCSKYNTVLWENNRTSSNYDKTISEGECEISIRDSNYSSVSDFKAAMDGVKLYYELATPVVYDLVNPINGTYKVADFGTEAIAPMVDNQGNPVSAPFKGIIKYNDDFTRQLVNVPKTYATKAEVEAGYAKKNGVESGLTAGTAQNLEGRGSTQAEFTRRTSGGTADIGTGSAQVLKYKGNSIVWNQLVNTPIFSETQEADIATFQIVSGHKYLFIINTSRVADNYGENYDYQIAAYLPSAAPWMYWMQGITNRNLFIETPIETGIVTISFFVYDNFKGEVSGSINVIDLTLMFGAGNEPSTVAEFESLFPLSYYEYNAGEILNFNSNKILTTGFNQWDEEWEVGTLDSDGKPYESNNNIRSKNFIPTLPSTQYFCKLNTFAVLFFYDTNKNFILSYSTNSHEEVFTTPSKAAYMKFYLSSGYGTTYNHDICINLSWSGYRNGEYEQYEAHEATLNLNSFRVKDSEGNIITIEGGLKGAGSAYDEIDPVRKKYIKRFGEVDLGDLEWIVNPHGTNVYCGVISDMLFQGKALCSKYKYHKINATDLGDYEFTNRSTYIENSIDVRDSSYSDATTFKAAVSGVKLIYELATYEEYDLVDTLPQSYYVNDFGTEEFAPANTDEPTSAPGRMEIKYAMNASDTIRNLGKNYIKKSSMEAILSAMQSAGVIGGYTLTYNATDDDYDCTITAPTPSQSQS